MGASSRLEFKRGYLDGLHGHPAAAYEDSYMSGYQAGSQRAVTGMEETYKCEACGHVGSPESFLAPTNPHDITHECPRCKSEDVFSSEDPILDSDDEPRESYDEC